MIVRRAFTLIELLVVIAIILVLTALILGVGAGWLRERAKIMVTSHRLNQVQTGLAQYSNGVDLAEHLQRLDGFDRRLGTLQAILSQLTDHLGLDLSGLDASKVAATRGSYPGPVAGVRFAYPANGNLPPGLGTRWESARAKVNASGQLSSSGSLQGPRESRKYWPAPGTAMREVVMFMDRHIGRTSETSIGNNPISHFPNLATYHALPNNYYMMVSWDDISGRDYSGPYSSKLTSAAGGFVPKKGANSNRGESLERTREILPGDQIRSPAWYLEQWPNLREQLALNVDGDVVFSQTCWPESNWDQDSPGSVPVVWHWPWGRQIFSRVQGSAISQIDYQLDGAGEIQDRTLADLSPLSTLRLLQAAGIVPPGDEGAEAYRTDRRGSQVWNDSWGSPIIAVCASFMPARYDFDDEFDLMKHGESGQQIVRDSSSMLGGRDFFIEKSEEMYQFSRAFYVATGSLGGAHVDEIGDTWSAAEDAVNFRALWIRLRDDIGADAWTGRSYLSPPWNGVKHVKVGQQRRFLGAPVEYR